MKEQVKVLLPDCHHPYHDKRAISNVIRYIAETQPDEVCLLGDFLDVLAPSRWSKGTAAEFAAGMLQEANAGRETLASLRAVYHGPLTFLYGNHEDRLYNYVYSSAPALAGIVKDIPELLDFKGFGVEVQGQPYKIAPDTVAIHGDRLSKHAGQSAMKEMERHGASVVQGHSHRLGIVPRTDSKTRFALECGWLGDIKKIGYSKYKVENWQQGFATLDIRGSFVSPTIYFVQSTGGFKANGKWYGVAA